MPSPPHEILIELFRRDPSLAPQVLRTSAGIEVPPFTRTHTVDTTLRELLPVEHKADLLLLFANDAPVFAVILEVQLSIDAEKPYRWPTYVAAVHDRHRCPTVLVVLTTDDAVAAWARGPFQTGPGSTLTPVVLDGKNVQRHDTMPATERNAANVLLSVGVHVKSPAERALLTTAMDPHLPGVDAFGGAREYQKLLIAILPKLMRTAVEEQMGIDVSDIVPWTDILEARFEARGEARGAALGRLEGGRATFRRLAMRRGWTLTPEHLARLDGCTEIDRIEGWIERILTAASPDEALD